jgi:hypothetical protein
MIDHYLLFTWLISDSLILILQDKKKFLRNFFCPGEPLACVGGGSPHSKERRLHQSLPKEVGEIWKMGLYWQWQCWKMLENIFSCYVNGFCINWVVRFVLDFTSYIYFPKMIFPPSFGLNIFSPFRDIMRDVKFNSVIPKSPTLMWMNGGNNLIHKKLCNKNCYFLTCDNLKKYKFYCLIR